MKRFLNLVGWLLASTLTLAAQTVPLYCNDGPVQSPPDIAPQIDATAFCNNSTFNVFTTLPYDFTSCLFFTNSASMSGSPGFRFDFVTNAVVTNVTWTNVSGTNMLVTNIVVGPGKTRLAADWFLNEGQLSAQVSLLVFATNLVSPGSLDTTDSGIIRLAASNIVDLGRSKLRSGPSPLTYFGGATAFDDEYINDQGVSDLYWGAGFNNRLNNTGGAMYIDNRGYPNPYFVVPYVNSPVHQVLDASGVTNSVYLPGSLYGLIYNYGFYDVSVYSTYTTLTNRVIQMVFVPTNSLDPAFTGEVRFLPDFASGRAIVYVGFRSVDYDIVLEQNMTNWVVLEDSSATLTNIVLQDNLLFNTHRPSNYVLSRAAPFGWDLYYYYYTNNTIFTPDLIYSPAHQSNRVAVMYGGYAAQVGQASTYGGYGLGLPTPTLLIEPTNMGGRIEISGHTVNLEQTQIRSEALLSVKTKDLTSNFIAQVDAPFLIYDLTSTQPALVISNLAPSSVRRLSGQIAAWSGVWTSIVEDVVFIGTNYVTNLTENVCHALIVDPQLQTIRPVVLHEFAAHATNLVISDVLAIGKSVLIDATNLHVTGSLAFPPGANWAPTNVQNLVNITNEGSLIVPQVAYFGGAPSPPLSNFVNRGFVMASTHYIRAYNFENNGTALLANNGSIVATGGVLSLEVGLGTLTNSQLIGNGNIQIYANDLVQSNSVISAGPTNGSLILMVTNRLRDEGSGSSNFWTTSSGFRVLRRPLGGDLLGTRLETRITRLSSQASHIWPAENRGANVSGFSNNLALGWLTLNGNTNCLFVFNGVGTNDALYVDYLEFLNKATNYEAALQINSGLTIYFANANIPPSKLDRHPSGRLRWVKDYAGPNSSTNLTYPSGQTYTFNIALVQSKDIDSDGDGIVNAEDPTPIFVPESVGLTATLSSGPPLSTLLTWTALAGVTNTVEFKSDLSAPTWQVATNVVGGLWTAPVSVTLPVTPGSMRFYRVRIPPP